MKKITLSELFSLIEENDVQDDFDIRDETEFPNHFAITLSSTRETTYLELPRNENNYDFLWEEFKKFFYGRYSYISSHSCSGEYEISLVIDDKILINFLYTSKDGQNWLYILYKQV